MRALWVIAVALLPFGAWAQESDKDFLTRYLEENLSGAGRVVTITGFAGALSSRATMAQMTIADDQGIWLTVTDVALDWSQSSLLSGQVVINEFSAGEIDLARIPAGDPNGISPQARAFVVPDLPVSIDVSNISARHIVLGPTVLGQAVEGQLSATMQLSAGSGTVALDLLRTDTGPEGQFRLTAGFDKDSGQLDLSLTAIEGAGGVAVGLLGVPGAPSAELSLAGTGPIDDFVADVSLRTDDVTRLAGQVALTSDQGNRIFTANLSGDPTPVFLPAYAAFFGPDVTLHAKGQRFADGRMELARFRVTTRALTLDGTLNLDQSGVPEAFALTGVVGLPNGPVILPLTTDDPVSLNSGSLSLQFDRAVGPDWSGTATLKGLSHSAFSVDLANLAGNGVIVKTAEGASFRGAVTYGATGLRMTDPGMAQALGDAITGGVSLDWRSGNGFSATNLTIEGTEFGLAGNVVVEGVATGFASKGNLSGRVDDLSRFATLTGMPLHGQAEFSSVFENTFLTGALKTSGAAQGEGLGFGVAALDNLLKGKTDVTFDGWRDETGTTISSLTLDTAGFAANIGGRLAEDGANLAGTLDISDLRVLGAGYGGGFSGKATLTGPLETALVSVDATGRNLTIGQAQADLLLRGNSQLTAALNLTPDGLALRQLDITNPQIRTGITGANGRLQIDQRINDLGLLYPQFPGVLVAKGTAIQDAAGFAVDLDVTGPAQIDASVKGRLAANFGRADLAISGTASAGLANKLAAPRSLSGPVRFDLQMIGPFGLRSLSGPVTISGGQLADPAQTFGFNNIAGTAQLAAGQARVSMTSEVSSGGQVAVKGVVGILPPYTADLDIAVQGVTLRDPDLYTTRIDGRITLNGPALGAALLAGYLTLGRTELLIPSTGFGADGELPSLQHVREPEASRATRERAGQFSGPQVGGSGASGYLLNLRIAAPNQVFIRGRGLDAELGGALVLRGNIGAVVPSGAFNLIRGRLEILGRRLILSEALLQLQGALVPFVRIVASVESDGITASVLIEGAANDPQVSFTSSPQLPQEEVLARLLFDRGLENLTAFQAIQLAGAVATLAGTGGVGVIGNLRKRAGLDNLDIRSDGTSQAEVTLGKYLSDNAYTEVTVDQGGKSSVSINLDLAPHITLKGEVSSDGHTGIGIFLQRDY